MLNPYFWHVRLLANEPKLGIQLLLISYLWPESFVLASATILLLVFLLFIAV